MLGESIRRPNTSAQRRSQGRGSEVAMRRTTLPRTIRTSWSRPARSCAGRTWRRIYDLALVERVFSCISRPEIPPHPVAWTSSCYHVGTSRVEFRSRTMPCEKGSRNLYYASIHVSRWANGQSFNQFVARCKMVQGERHPSRRGELPCSDYVDDVVPDLQSIVIRRRPADIR